MKRTQDVKIRGVGIRETASVYRRERKRKERENQRIVCSGRTQEKRESEDDMMWREESREKIAWDGKKGAGERGRYTFEEGSLREVEIDDNITLRCVQTVCCILTSFVSCHTHTHTHTHLMHTHSHGKNNSV